jgi:MFS family permease
MYTSGVEGMQESFNVSSKIVVLLGLTTNLFGLAIGSVVLSSLSEIYGRRPVYLISVFLFGLLILPVALAKNIETVLISRFFGGFFGGVMIASAPGSVTDVTDDQYRALALSCWSLGTMNGPVLGNYPFSTDNCKLFPRRNADKKTSVQVQS